MTNLTGAQEGWLSVNQDWEVTSTGGSGGPYVRAGRLFVDGRFLEDATMPGVEVETSSEEFIRVGMPADLARESDLSDD